MPVLYNFLIWRLLQPFTLLYFIGALVVLNLWRKRRETRKRLICVTAVFLGMTLVCLPIVGHFAVGTLEWQNPPLKGRPADVQAIVVLSSYAHPPSQLHSEPELDEASLNRCLQAAAVYQQGPPCPVLVTGGKTNIEEPGPTCSAVMRDFLVRLGVKESDLIVEDNSRSTYENAVESRKLLEERHLHKIILVTDGTHLVRAAGCFRKQGLEVVPSGCRYRAAPIEGVYPADFVPDLRAARLRTCLSRVARPGLVLAPGQNVRSRIPREAPLQIILSFDVEEHDRIESATGLNVAPSLREHYRGRLEPATRWLLDELNRKDLRATFFLLGQIAQYNAGLIRAIHQAGHEVASHGWDHQRIHNFTPAQFREDVRQSRDALEQITGEAVVGYRAPTFSILPKTAWALDVLADLGMLYDSSIYPVRHDRYGVPRAPRSPFRAWGESRDMLEIPPATLRICGTNIPVGGGGYFRLLPRFLLERAMLQVREACRPAVVMLYFHPWEFDPRQERLPLRALSRWRTYVGVFRSRARLTALLNQPRKDRFVRAVDVARALVGQALPRFNLA